MKLRVGSLFSGIGGLELGLEWSGGFETVFQVEQDQFCRDVLARHWPNVARFGDVRDVGAHNLPACDVLCGGFPCQDISLAGKGAGLDGERSGLWFEFARIIREIRPQYILVENVAALLDRGFGRVLGDLAASGFDAQWDCIPASAVGAPHERDRVFLLAYPKRERVERIFVQEIRRQPAFSWCESIRGPEDLRGRSDIPEPLISRKGDGVSRRMDKPGNAVVPQVAQYIGECIMAFHAKLESNAA